KRILIAIDKSGYKNKIVSTAFDIAKGLGAEIFAIHVIDRASPAGGGDMLVSAVIDIEAHKQEIKRDRESLVNHVRDQGASLRIKVTPEVIFNDSAASAILDYAKDHSIDLLVVGTQGMTGVQRFLLGSVAHKVVMNAHCPVLAIR